MTYADEECSVTITRARYAELVIAEQDAKKLKAFLAMRAEQWNSITGQELELLRDLYMPKDEVEE